MRPDNQQQLVLFIVAAKDISFGVGAAWKERSGWKTKAWSLGKYVTARDAILFGIDINLVTKSLLSIADHCCAKIGTKSRLALTIADSAR